MTDDLLTLLGEVARKFQGHLSRMPALRDLGLSPFEGKTLAIIARHEGCSQQALAASTGRDKGQIARAIRRLEARYLIVRSVDPTNWRSQALKVTPAGASVFATLDNQRAQLVNETLAVLTLDEQATLAAAFDKLKMKLGPSVFENVSE